MRAKSLLQVSLLAFCLASCATGDKKGGKGDSGADRKGGGDDDDDGGSEKGGSDEGVSQNFNTFIYSLSNNGLTSFTVNSAKAKSVAEDLDAKLKSPTSKDRKEFIALMAAKRLSGEGVSAVFQVAKRLMIVEMKDNIKKNMPEVAMLELALASIQSKQIPMAEHWIGKLLQSKNGKTRAAAFTAKGIIALLDSRLPEAVSFWNEALKNKSDYEPARLNIAFTALRYGDVKTAKAMFQGVQQDWFVQTGVMQTERLSDNSSETQTLCKSILEKKPNYKPALFSCALNEYQGIGNLAKARLDLEHIAKASGGPSSIDEKAYLVLGKIEKDVYAQQQKEGAAKAAASRAKAAAAAPANGGAVPGGAPANGAAPAAGGPQKGNPAPAGNAPQP